MAKCQSSPPGPRFYRILCVILPSDWCSAGSIKKDNLMLVDQHTQKAQRSRAFCAGLSKSGFAEHMLQRFALQHVLSKTTFGKPCAESSAALSFLRVLVN